MPVRGYVLIYLKGAKRGRMVPGYPVYRDRANAAHDAQRFNPYPDKFTEVGIKEVQVSGK